METPRMHPMMWVATVAVTLFSLVGIGAITGIIPKAGGEVAAPKPLYADSGTPSTPGLAPILQPGAATPTATAPVTPQPAPVVTSPPPTPPAVTKLAQAESIPQPSKPKPISTPTATPAIHAPSRPVIVATPPAPAPKATTYGPPPDALPAPASAASPQAPVVHEICRDCGVIETVREIKSQGQSSGIGAIAGGIIGGVLGSQVGGGHGREVATVAGAVAGGFAGNEMERNQRSGSSRYQTVVRFEDGTTQLFTEDGIPHWRIGQKVKVEGGVIIPR